MRRRPADAAATAIGRLEHPRFGRQHRLVAMRRVATAARGERMLAMDDHALMSIARSASSERCAA